MSEKTTSLWSFEVEVQRVADHYINEIKERAAKSVEDFKRSQPIAPPKKTQLTDINFQSEWDKLKGKLPSSNREIFLAGFNAGKSAERVRAINKLLEYDHKMGEFVARIIE